MSDVDLFGIEALERRASDGLTRQDGGSDEWLTPPDVLAAVGPFDLDPCSPGDRRPWDTAARHLSIEDDGMRCEWTGRVWLNPPYSDAGRWIARLAEHGVGTALIFARTETRMWHEHIWPKASGLLFLRGRLRFHYVTGKAAGTAAAPSVLVAFGAHDAAKLETCGLDGAFVRLHPDGGETYSCPMCFTRAGVA
jgi:hypothetical protein